MKITEFFKENDISISIVENEHKKSFLHLGKNDPSFTLIS